MNFQWISQTPSVNFPWNLAHSKNSTVKSRIFSRELGWSLVTRSVFVSVLMMLPADSKVVQSGAVLLLWTRIKTKMNWESYSMSRRFRHSCLKANKVSSSEETRKVEYADNFWKCAGAFYSCLSKLQLAKVGLFFRHSLYTLPYYHMAGDYWTKIALVLLQSAKISVQDLLESWPGVRWKPVEFTCHHSGIIMMLIYM